MSVKGLKVPPPAAGMATRQAIDALTIAATIAGKYLEVLGLPHIDDVVKVLLAPERQGIAHHTPVSELVNHQAPPAYTAAAVRLSLWHQTDVLLLRCRG